MNSINLEVVNGHWTMNQKPLKNCSIAKKNLLAQFIKMRLVKTEISQRSSFKQRANEIKQKYNYKFTNLQRESFENQPNINNLIFERKN